MQELKPVRWIYQRTDSEDCVCPPMRWPKSHVTENWREVPLYAIPDTHRIVPVELLERVHQFSAVAAEHYSGMNDEVCQSYSQPWQQGVALCKELKAIIDKEPT